MGSKLKRLLRKLYHKIDGRISRRIEDILRPLIAAELERAIQPAIEAARADVHDSCTRADELIAHLRRSAQENTILLDSLVRELVRLQMQIEGPETSRQDPPAFEEESAGERVMVG
jgi:hypothetical protein